MDEGFARNVAVGSACFGRADAVTTAVVTGWFIAPSKGGTADQITAFIDGEPAGHALVAAGGISPGAPAHAERFSYSIPWNYQDGRAHVLSLILGNGTAIEFPTRGGVTRSNVRFRFEESTRPLVANVSGRDLDAEVQEAPSDQAQPFYTGRVEAVSGSTITGWAISLRSPDERVRLRMFVDGYASGSVNCDQQHEKLNVLGHPGGAGGFSFDIPDRFLDGTTHSLSVLFADGSPLPFSDPAGGTRTNLEFTAAAITSIDGVVDGLHGENIRGWVVRKHRRTGVVQGGLQVQVLCNGIILAEVLADRPRADVARDYGYDPYVGFEFKLPRHCLEGFEFEFVFKALPEGTELAGCPLRVKHPLTKDVDELRALADTIGDLCAKVFKLQRQVHGMLPVQEATVLNYDGWARRYLGRLRARMEAMEPLPVNQPLISILMPTSRTNLAHLTAAIESVRVQTYRNWELIIVDDGSRQRALTACLKNSESTDSRIQRLVSRASGGIGAAINAGVRKAAGSYIVLFEPNDLLVEVAVEAMVRKALSSGAKIVYSDEDHIGPFGEFSEPILKPDWNYRLLLSVDYVRHLLMIDRPLMCGVGLLQPECDGAYGHDLLLRLSEKCRPGQIVHLPEILYHCRVADPTVADAEQVRRQAVEAGCRAVSDHLARRGFSDFCVTPAGPGGTFRVVWSTEGLDKPKVTIIVPFKDQIATTRRCLEALLASTDWPDWDVVLIDNGSVTPAAERFCREAALNTNVTVQRIEGPFNYAGLNNRATRSSKADWYLFLNNDVFLQQRDWLQVMMGEALADPKVAVVGAKLTYPDGKVQHGGVILGVGGVADHAFRGLPFDHPGYMSRARCAQELSAVTGACMLCRADAFAEVEGFDEQDLAVTFNDIDLCLKIGRAGWRVIWTPDVVAEHHESLSRGDDISPGKAQRSFYETNVMLERWPSVITSDPHYNPHFSRDNGIFSALR